LGVVIAVISGKGGVGKTTATANVGLGIAKNNKKCVVVDFDIGQRNLDMILGLENRVVYDLVQVMDKECTLRQALIKSKANENLYFLAASQTKDKSVLVSEKVQKLVENLKKEFDFNPEVSSIRDADRAIGILDSKSQKVKEGEEVSKYLIINRIVAEMVQSGEMLRSEDILDILNIRLLGKVPEDKGVIDASNQGIPIVQNKNSIAGQAYQRIADRLCGQEIAIKNVEVNDKGLFGKIAGIFH